MSAANKGHDGWTRRRTGRYRLIWSLQSFLVLIAIWLALNGPVDLWLGLLAAAVGAALGGWLASGRPHPWRPHRLIAFGGFFLWESIKGSVDVAWRAMHPKLHIDPCFSHHPLRLPDGQPRTLMVSIVSLLPGTLSVNINNRQTLLVHALTPESSASVPRLEAWVAWLFSLEQVPE